MLGEAWPGDASREALIAGAFRIRHADDTHRARLCVELERLRMVLRPLAEINATERGFALVPCRAKEVAVLVRPVEGDYALLLAFLSDGQAWSSSALALALNASQRTVRRALDTLASENKVQSIGRRRCPASRTRCCYPRRSPVTETRFTTLLLLPRMALHE
ncbi:Malic enzyme [Candidatus Paraburkholderia calva]|nr:Malic enzyme [Candidatus Paraburkholderia calva]